MVTCVQVLGAMLCVLGIGASEDTPPTETASDQPAKEEVGNPSNPLVRDGTLDLDAGQLRPKRGAVIMYREIYWMRPKNGAR